MGVAKDLTGQKFTRLLVVSRASNGGMHGLTVRWNCRCDCGVEKIVAAPELRRGRTLSCGCLKKERQRAAVTTHGHSPVSGETAEYRAWRNLRQRCLKPKERDRKYYGGRGIKVCDRWLNDFATFLADMGHRPPDKHTIDRIDPDGNYEPSNCRWATWTEQRHNTRAYIERHGRPSWMND